MQPCFNIWENVVDWNCLVINSIFYENLQITDTRKEKYSNVDTYQYNDCCFAYLIQAPARMFDRSDRTLSLSFVRKGSHFLSLSYFIHHSRLSSYSLLGGWTKEHTGLCSSHNTNWLFPLLIQIMQALHFEESSQLAR